MLKPNDLTDIIINKFKTISSSQSSDYFNALNTSLAEYFINNTDFTFAWSGSTPNGTPDPITITHGKFTSLLFSLSPSYATTQEQAIHILSTQITASFQTSLITITDIGFTTNAVIPTIITPCIINIPPTATSQNESIFHLCNNIINFVKSLTCPPIVGNRGPFVGTATLISIQ